MSLNLGLLEPQLLLWPSACSGLGPYMQRGMHPTKLLQNSAILELAAQLAENSAMRQEIILNGHRRCHLEVCMYCLYHRSLHTLQARVQYDSIQRDMTVAS